MVPPGGGEAQSYAGGRDDRDERVLQGDAHPVVWPQGRGGFHCAERVERGLQRSVVSRELVRAYGTYLSVLTLHQFSLLKEAFCRKDKYPMWNLLQ